MIKIINEEVLYSDSKLVLVDAAEVEELKRKSIDNKRKRIRLCAHLDVNDRVHEMIIIHAKDAYVRPHKHLNKSESLHVIEGSADLVIYDDLGQVSKVFPLGGQGAFFCRMSEPFYHNIIMRSQIFVFHEVTGGPFDRKDTLFAPWAPKEEDLSGRIRYIEQVEDEILRRTRK